jgi:asparagine synthase (glutamine-hydrolysing)
VCGIAGLVHPDPFRPVAHATLSRMARAIRHRGPDGYGIATDGGVGLVSTRLAIIDIEAGWQPMRTPTSAIVFNGEVYNHTELRAGLGDRVRDWRTDCDTEVILRLLDLDGLAALDHLNGQFAIAWWQPGSRRLTLIRDRFGVRPLYYSVLPDGSLVFGSEAKCLFASGLVRAEPDREGIDEVFHLWGARAPRTPFAGVRQVRPGGIVAWEDGRIVADTTWWTPEVDRPGRGDTDLEELLRDSVRLRLRADVTVGTYLSGGLDSSLITALAVEEAGEPVETFSVAFADAEFDERVHQREVARSLDVRHHQLTIDDSDIAGAFLDTIRHTETPSVRTAPIPLGLLARSVREAGIVVVATGEGADEVFWGYDLFKEAKIRRFALREPGSGARPALFDRLYAHMGGRLAGTPFWRRALMNAGDPSDPLFSHQSRLAATGVTRSFYEPGLRRDLDALGPLDRIRASLPPAFASWSTLQRASWLEITTLLEPYLLSTQGDRVAMAHGVEGRYPFLDHRVLEWAASQPDHRKLSGLRDKVAVREVARRVLPPAAAAAAARPKQPYRAPEIRPFFPASGAPDWVRELLAPDALRDAGFFDPGAVAGLVRRAGEGRIASQREAFALVGIVSTQAFVQTFCPAGGPPAYPEETTEPRRVLDLSMPPAEVLVS